MKRCSEDTYVEFITVPTELARMQAWSHRQLTNISSIVYGRKAWKIFVVRLVWSFHWGKPWIRLFLINVLTTWASTLTRTITPDEQLILPSSSHPLWNHLLQNGFESNFEPEGVPFRTVGVLCQRPSACFSVWTIWIVSPNEPDSVTKTLSKDEAAFPADTESTRVYAAGDVFRWPYRYL